MGNLEVLAPVGSFKNLKLAINSGANAVYFGVKNFNARQKAENVELEQLEQFVNLAHLHNVKTYMTLNTLIKNEEFDDVIKVVDEAVRCKVDAFIVQDIGLATYLLGRYKNIILHASTQMGIHNLAGARVLESLGFKRVVLSRETRLSDIIDIHKNTNLEIEYFVQGALCVAFSGNCYFSSLCFGESGNRGRCLQPCRMCYEAFNESKKIKEGYLISPKDICLIKQLGELIDAGVTSFKIEGRLRRESYLVQAVTTYVKALFNKCDIENEIQKLKKVFSRGEYNYGNYLTGNDGVIDCVNSNHKGEKIGRVESFKPFKNLFQIELKINKKLNAGDGVKIINGNKELTLGVGNVDYKNGNAIIYTKYKPIMGDVYLSLDSEYESKLMPKEKKIPLSINVVGREKSPLLVTVKTGGNEINIASDFVCESAKNQPITKADIEEIFSRIKDTEFELKEIKIDIDKIFIAKSIINKIKNNCIIEMEKLLLKNVNKDIENVIKVGDCDIKYELNDRFNDNFRGIITSNENMVNDNNFIILNPKVYNLKAIETFVNEHKNKFIFLNLPIICTGDEVKIIDEIVNHFDSEKLGVVVNNYWGLKYSETRRWIAGYNMNIINDHSIKFYDEMGAENFIRSIEGSLINGLKGGVSYEGFPTLMTWCHCPYKVSCNSSCENCKSNDQLVYKLNDGKTFRIRRYKIINCYFELISNKKITSKSNNKIVDLRQ